MYIVSGWLSLRSESGSSTKQKVSDSVPVCVLKLDKDTDPSHIGLQTGWQPSDDRSMGKRISIP